jgi:hypothetical protein
LVKTDKMTAFSAKNGCFENKGVSNKPEAETLWLRHHIIV